MSRIGQWAVEGALRTHFLRPMSDAAVALPERQGHAGRILGWDVARDRYQWAIFSEDVPVGWRVLLWAEIQGQALHHAATNNSVFSELIAKALKRQAEGYLPAVAAHVTSATFPC